MESAIITAICGGFVSIATFVAGRKLREGDAIRTMQETINVLAKKNDEYYDRIICLQEEVGKLRRQVAELTEDNRKLADSINKKNNGRKNVRKDRKDG